MPVGIYLSGGTALSAYYFKHCLSDDLDFFSYEEFDTQFIHKFAAKIKQKLKAKTVTKIEFTKYPFLQLSKPKIVEGLKIDSLKDIAANKLMAILDRFDPKDFVDLYFILQERDLQTIRIDAQSKFQVKIEAIFLGSELAKVSRVNVLPKMLKTLEIEGLKSFFSKIAKELSGEIFA